MRFESAEVDKLYTFFDTKQYTINNAVGVDSFKDGKSFYVKAHQYRLNYKPFTYKFAINSDKDTKSFVKIFLGPAGFEGENFDEFTYFRHYYKYFVMLDEFEVNRKLTSFHYTIITFIHSTRIISSTPMVDSSNVFIQTFSVHSEIWNQQR